MKVEYVKTHVTINLCEVIMGYMKLHLITLIYSINSNLIYSFPENYFILVEKSR